MSQLFNGDDNRILLALASPLSLLSPGDPPGYVVQGDLDSVVDPGNAYRADLFAARQGVVPGLRVDVIDRSADGLQLPEFRRLHEGVDGLNLTSLQDWLARLS